MIYRPRMPGLMGLPRSTFYDVLARRPGVLRLWMLAVKKFEKTTPGVVAGDRDLRRDETLRPVSSLT